MASAPSPCNSATSSCPCLSRRPDTKICGQPSLESLFGYPMKVGTNTTIEGERRSSRGHRCQYAFVRKAARQGTRFLVQALPALHLRPLALCKFADCQLSKEPFIVQRLRPTLPP